MSDSHSTMNPTGGAEARRSGTQPALHVDLMEQVVAPQNMRRAWRQVKANKGAPGIDGMRIEDFPAYAREHWSTIRQAPSRWQLPPATGAPGERSRSREGASDRWAYRPWSIG